MMITKPALHRVSNLGVQVAAFNAHKELQGDVSTYLELLQMQLDAAEDEDMLLASSIGKSMCQIREKYNPEKWLRELHKQDTANDF